MWSLVFKRNFFALVGGGGGGTAPRGEAQPVDPAEQGDQPKAAPGEDRGWRALQRCAHHCKLPQRSVAGSAEAHFHLGPSRQMVVT